MIATLAYETLTSTLTYTVIASSFVCSKVSATIASSYYKEPQDITADNTEITADSTRITADKE